ncbi:MAG: LytR C-terminal domain-containing protein, partial [Coriobacteriales bacterium]|nr:LytR C-terminal domain-containing protein [Coriobacteriales bacterium]
RRSSAGAKRVVPSKVSVEVRNGIGVTGVGADAARRRKAAGYRIGDVGNAGQFVYKETLVIHKGNEAAAKQVARELPVGRVVPSRGMYGFDATVLVVIGKDWVRQP